MPRTILGNISDEELQAELDRRKAEREEAAKPQPIAEPDWSKVRAMAVKHVEDTLRRERQKDAETHIYETVLEAVYGADIWTRLNAIFASWT